MLGFLVLLLSIVAIFIPVIGGHLTLIPALLAFFASGRGVRLAWGGSLLNALNVVILSDIMRYNAVMGLKHHKPIPVAIFGGLILLHAVVAAVTWRRWHALAAPVTERES